MKIQTLGEVQPPPGSGITRTDMSNPDPWIRARAAVYYDWNYIPWEELNDEEIRAIQRAQSNLTPQQISAGNAWTPELQSQVAASGFQTILVSPQEYQAAQATNQIPQSAIDRMGAQYASQVAPRGVEINPVLPSPTQPEPAPLLPAPPTQPEAAPLLPAPPIQNTVSDADIRNFVFSVLNNASLTDAQRRAQILEAMRQYGISDARVAQATGYTLAEVRAFLYPTSSGGVGPVIGPVTGGAVAPVTGADVVMTPGTRPVLDAGFPDTNAPPSNSGSAVPLLALGLALSLLS